MANALSQLTSYFQAKDEHLRVLAYLNHSQDSKGANKDKILQELKLVSHELDKIDQLLQQFSQCIQREKDAIGEAKKLEQDLKTNLESFKHLEANVPAKLLERLSTVSSTCEDEKENVKDEPASNIPVCNTEVNKKQGILPAIELVTPEELDSIPHYIRGRLSLKFVNSTLENLLKVARIKYKILNKPKSAMNQQTLAKFRKFKDAECDETAGKKLL
ncbi:Spindle and kinetochore-associated protein 1 [Trichoplax sp. H2]|nr:Spindle and kinetochore-associated protein 1 [Trichoplax sp. H2]|eukprot:RDD45145.1 Spindle and kinetochore-associated protein 1 [Trichoplax sp. H2]